MTIKAQAYEPRRIAILGSTGSVGTQALDVIRSHPQNFVIEVLAANSNVDLLIKQALEFQPNITVIGREELYQDVFDALDPKGIKVYSGSEALEQVVQMDGIDLVLAAIVGYAGLRSTLSAVKAGKRIAPGVASERPWALAEKAGSCGTDDDFCPR